MRQQPVDVEHFLKAIAADTPKNQELIRSFLVSCLEKGEQDPEASVSPLSSARALYKL